ncbi:MAG: dGTPase [Pseudomonadota bacterium]|nr:dGTPase [Pseudomonadota bacterium]
MSDLPYSRLISPRRARNSTMDDRSMAEEAISDRGRILFSGPFRRLQGKAQVFPLEPNAAVRTRLTHSLEVAHHGRAIARRIVDSLGDAAEALGLDNSRAVAFVELAETACLMHDLGNPPFGHFGEAAIQGWFKQHGLTAARTAVSLPERTEDIGAPGAQALAAFAVGEFRDFLDFDGNPQGFRIVTKLQWNLDHNGLNLTYTQLAAYLKYLYPPGSTGEDLQFGKKAGYFHTEAALMSDLRKELGLPEAARHPLAYIMEAADDIAYCLSDIEDGIEKGILGQEEALRRLNEAWDSLERPPGSTNLIEHYADGKSDFFLLKVKLTRHLVESAAAEYTKHHAKVLEGSAGSLLDSDDVPSDEVLALKALKRFARKHLFRNYDAESVELAGYATITGLLERYRPLLTCTSEDMERVEAFIEKGKKLGDGKELLVRLYNRLPKKYRAAYWHARQNVAAKGAGAGLAEWHLRAHLIVDYVAGMTDEFALQEYQMLSGIKVA